MESGNGMKEPNQRGRKCDRTKMNNAGERSAHQGEEGHPAVISMLLCDIKIRYITETV